MYEQRKPPIKEFLRLTDTQENIQRKIIEVRSAATVTITRAAELFDFSDTQLRDWDRLGFVRPPRSDGDKQEDKKHRQYSRAELDVLAAIRILRDSGYSITEIRQNIEVIRDIADQLGHNVFTLPGESDRKLQIVETTQEHASLRPIDQLLDNADNELFWRFYATNSLSLSLSLLAEYNPNTIIGIVVPLGSNTRSIVTETNLAELGECLVGWLRPGYLFNLLYTPCPSFEVPTDFQIHPMQNIQINIWTVVQRKPGRLNISPQVRTTIQCLLAPLYEHRQEWLPFFKEGQHSFSFPKADFVPEAAGNPTKRIHLTSLANLMVSMGPDKGWSFACILTPSNPQLSISEQQLIVQAVSEKSPEAYKEKLEKTIILPTETVISVSMRAYQSGRICYRHRAVPQDESIFNYDLEHPLGSCIAIPIGGEEAKPLGVIYVASSKQDAFDKGDQRLLRMIARMAQDLLLTFQVRTKIGDQLKLIMENPALTDPVFDKIPSESDFIVDVEGTLRAIFANKVFEDLLAENLAMDDVKERRKKMAENYDTSEVLTFYCIDIDNQTLLAQKYGDVLAKNLSMEVGRLIQDKLKISFPNSNFKLYHAYGDRFFVRLEGIPLKEAQERSRAFKKELDSMYKVNALRSSNERRPYDEMLVEVSITTRLGISCYPFVKLYELMHRPSAQFDPVTFVATTIRIELDRVLKEGPGVHTWDTSKWGWAELTQKELIINEAQ
jgi:DNA-binding transcriptional MerR regulator